MYCKQNKYSCAEEYSDYDGKMSYVSNVFVFLYEEMNLCYHIKAEKKKLQLESEKNYNKTTYGVKEEKI